MLLREAEALGDSKARGGDAGEAAPGATRSDEVHPGVQCDGCDQFPITGAWPCCSVVCHCRGASTYLKEEFRLSGCQGLDGRWAAHNKMDGTVLQARATRARCSRTMTCAAAAASSRRRSAQRPSPVARGAPAARRTTAPRS